MPAILTLTADDLTLVRRCFAAGEPEPETAAILHFGAQATAEAAAALASAEPDMPFALSAAARKALRYTVGVGAIVLSDGISDADASRAMRLVGAHPGGFV